MLEPCPRSPRLPFRSPFLVLALALVAALPVAAAPPIGLPGLDGPARVVRDGAGVPHIYAATDAQAAYMLGYVHAQDRFFQMDLFRRTFSGRLAELVGPGGLASDVELRTLGLRRAADEAARTASAESLAWLQAYADGVNDWLARNPLPPEYTALELTRGGVPPWVPADSLVIGKALAFQLSFDLEDIDRTIALAAFQTVGELAGFDGSALFAEDLYRSAPFEATATVPGFLEPPLPPSLTAAGDSTEKAVVAKMLAPSTVEFAAGYLERVRRVPALSPALDRSERQIGSNWWMIGPELSATGAPMLANDPHLGLDLPSIFYEVQMMAFDPARWRPLVASGVSFPGTPTIVLGCNLHICWGATTNPMDVTDVYVEELVVDPATGFPAATRFRGAVEPLVAIPQQFRVNTVGDGAADNLVDSGIGPAEGGVTFIVPRRNQGPLVALDLEEGTALSVQYTGFSATRELDTFRFWMRAANLDDFVKALQLFDVGSQNFAYVDRQGNFAYFSSAEMPLREDLQAGTVAGLPPYFLRDGTGGLPNEWIPATSPDPTRAIPYETLPFSEMPQVVNPPEGFILNANNDPVGTTFDNNPLNQLRPGGGLYYLSPGYADLRGGRIAQMIEARIEAGEPFTVEDLQRMQADHQLLDAQLLVPVILEAFENAGGGDAPASLAALAADAGVTEAVMRLGAWDFTTPTGIPQGFDPFDDPANLPAPSQAEIDASVAATLYAAWRSRMIDLVVDQTLAGLGLADFRPGGTLAFRAMGHQLLAFDQTQGVGASGVDFFPVPGVDREAARDTVVLQALADALDLLASDTMAPAFGGSTDQDDYRWGYLHRIVFDHPLGAPLSAPPAGLADVAPGLPGVARSGGFGTVDAAAHDPRADGPDEFMFGSGPARRFIGVMERSGVEALQVIPGGISGVPGSPLYLNQIALWLTNRYHEMIVRPGQIPGAATSQQQYVPERL